MARSRSRTWTVIISLLVGVVGASIFWLYSPYGHDRLAQQVGRRREDPTASRRGERRARESQEIGLPGHGVPVSDGDRRQAGVPGGPYRTGGCGGISTTPKRPASARKTKVSCPWPCITPARSITPPRRSSRPPAPRPPKPHRRGSSRNEPGVAAGPGLGRVHPGGSLALGADAAVGTGAPVLAGRTGPAPCAGAGPTPGRNSSRE